MYEVASIDDYVRCMLEEAGLPPGCAPVDVVGHGQSGDLIATVGAWVVKFAPGEHPDNVATLAREAEVVRWLDGRVRVAANLWSGAFEGGFCLISERLRGEAVSHVGPRDAADALAATVDLLARLHALDPAGCPYDMSLAARFALAERHVAEGLVDEDDFDDERAGWTARQALDHAIATRPAIERLVLTHGDASLPNFIWSPGRPVGMVDLGRFGLADRYQDLALFLRSAKFNHPHIDAAAILRERYPLAEVDEAACAFYRLMDEFF
ncbi:aminoglycoside 3'-phosphotransferase [Phenylobacterium sp.]|uniref:aminoglycoside 3'-phosphotransferase n=1 Tax=Phenylobacterium sp. TaxID=1871053 RepID=UPI002898EA4F|nr:aminoglycoside 3'-phosphotransferase [Phenylobacterium sp.]